MKKKKEKKKAEEEEGEEEREAINVYQSAVKNRARCTRFPISGTGEI